MTPKTSAPTGAGTTSVPRGTVIERVLDTLMQVQRLFAQMEDESLFDTASDRLSKNAADVRFAVHERINETRRFVPQSAPRRPFIGEDQ